MDNSGTEPLSLEEIKKACQITEKGDENAQRVCRINEEITQGLELMGRYPKKVTFFGSARFPKATQCMKKRETLQNCWLESLITPLLLVVAVE